jgi:H+/Cl- antiporter ClcA
MSKLIGYSILACACWYITASITFDPDTRAIFIASHANTILATLFYFGCAIIATFATIFEVMEHRKKP